MDAVTLKIFSTAVHLIKTSGWEDYKSYLLNTIKDTKDPAYRPKDGFYTDYGQ